MNNNFLQADHLVAQEVLDFWFDHSEQWFAKSADFDESISEAYGRLLVPAATGELYMWRSTVAGRLAEIIILDQFSRNVYRNTPKAFAQDAMALALAQEALKLPEFTKLPTAAQIFMAMPLMHSESPIIHDQAVAVFRAIGDANTLDFEYRHKAIIDRFGRYPHRNAILGRPSSAEEVAFLQTADSAF